MDGEMEVKVQDEDKGLRLPHFIQKRLFPQLSLKEIKRGLEENQCRVNARLERFHSYTVREGDLISFTPPTTKAFNLIYEDDSLALVDKPPFVVCDEEKGLLGWRLAHRLDKETSGVLLLAKTEMMEKLLITLFKERKVKKTYVAVVEASPKESSGVIQDPISHQTAVTAWKLIKRGKETSLIECYPETGRTHQIRIHLANHMMPILGDLKYGKKSLDLRVRDKGMHQAMHRVMLHAKSLEFVHPLTGKILFVEAPLPKEFYEALDR